MISVAKSANVCEVTTGCWEICARQYWCCRRFCSMLGSRTRFSCQRSIACAGDDAVEPLHGRDAEFPGRRRFFLIPGAGEEMKTGQASS